MDPTASWMVSSRFAAASRDGMCWSRSVSVDGSTDGKNGPEGVVIPSSRVRCGGRGRRGGPGGHGNPTEVDMRVVGGLVEPVAARVHRPGQGHPADRDGAVHERSAGVDDDLHGEPWVVDCAVLKKDLLLLHRG